MTSKIKYKIARRWCNLFWVTRYNMLKSERHDLNGHIFNCISCRYGQNKYRLKRNSWIICNHIEKGKKRSNRKMVLWSNGDSFGINSRKLSISGIYQLLLTWFWWNIKCSFLWTSWTDSNYQADIDQATIVLGAFVHIRNISAVTDSILTKLQSRFKII